MPATHPAHSDQASRAAVRVVTRPLGCRGQLPNTPWSLVAQAGSSGGTLPTPRLLSAGACWTASSQRTVPGSLRTSSERICPARVCDTAFQVSSQLSDGPLAGCWFARPGRQHSEDQEGCGHSHRCSQPLPLSDDATDQRTKAGGPKADESES
jgi:hypothetical protein